MENIEKLLSRGVDKIYPSKEELFNVIRSGKKLRVYQGFDPTSPNLHIGHMIGLKKLKHWQELGHEVIFLIGDFTATIGDPTGKDKTRVPLTFEQVLENAKTYKEQASKILKFTGVNPVKIKFNSEWLAKLTSIEIAQLLSLLTYKQVIERDMFQRRIENNMDIAISEFFYPILQGYDSVAMDVDLEVGGSDQMFNMMIGRDLLHKIKRKNKFVMTTPLLEDSQGRKIGKTEGNAISFTDSPDDMYAKIMSFPDDLIVKSFEYLTDVKISEIEKIKNQLESGKNPITFKKMLAFEITKQLNNEKEAIKAEENFQKTVQGKEIPTEVGEIILNPDQNGMSLADILVEFELTDSKSEAKRIIEQNGVTLDGEILPNPHEPFMPEEGSILKVGKRKFARIKLNK